MIVHKTVRPILDPLYFAEFFKQMQIIDSVLIAKEHSLTAVAPLNNMVGTAGDDNSSDAGDGFCSLKLIEHP